MKKEEQHYWLFVDSKTRIVSRRLLQEEAENFVKELQNINLENWWAWNPCFRDWIRLENIMDNHTGVLRLLIQLIDVDSKKTVYEEIEKTKVEKTESTKIPKEYTDVRFYLQEEGADDLKDFHGDDISISRIPKPPTLGIAGDRRRAYRQKKRIEVLIAGQGKSFRTFTVNISLSGVLLEQNIPVDLDRGPFEIVFFLLDNGKKQNLAYQGKVSGDLKDRRRLVFGDLSESGKKLLEMLLDS